MKLAEIAHYSYREFLAREASNPAPVIDKLAEPGCLTFLFGAPGSGKSWLGLEACRCVAVGWDYLGLFACRKAPVLLVEQESAPGKLQGRFRLLEKAGPFPGDAEALTILPCQGLRLDYVPHQKALRALLEELRPRLVVVDTIGAMVVTDLFKPEGVATWLHPLRLWAVQLEIAFLLVCHVPKATEGLPDLKHLFGSVALGAAADYAFATQKLGTEPPSYRLACVKSRWGEDLPDLVFNLEPGESGGLILTAGEKQATVVEIAFDLITVGDWIAAKEITAEIEAAGFTRRSANSAFSRLLSGGRIEARTGPGKGGPREFRRLK